MKTQNTQQLRGAFAYHRRGGKGESIFDTYKKPSFYKQRAFYLWKQEADKLGSTDLRILSASCQEFSLGFTFTDAESGQRIFAYITKDYNRYMIID